MPHVTLPQALDLERKLVATGIFSYPAPDTQQLFDLQLAVGAAAEWWQDATGYRPFLADSVETTHYFEPDGSKTVDLKGGFVSISAIAVNGNAITLNTGYRVMPPNAIANVRPITYLKFDTYYQPIWSYYAPLPGNQAPVSVTGIRGAYAVLPDTAWNAILAKACMDMAPDIVNLVSDRGIKSWKSGTTEETYNSDPMATSMAGWQSVIDRALSPSSGNRRMRIG